MAVGHGKRVGRTVLVGALVGLLATGTSAAAQDAARPSWSSMFDAPPGAGDAASLAGEPQGSGLEAFFALPERLAPVPVEPEILVSEPYYGDVDQSTLELVADIMQLQQVPTHLSEADTRQLLDQASGEVAGVLSLLDTTLDDPRLSAKLAKLIGDRSGRESTFEQAAHTLVASVASTLTAWGATLPERAADVAGALDKARSNAGLPGDLQAMRDLGWMATLVEQSRDLPGWERVSRQRLDPYALQTHLRRGGANPQNVRLVWAAPHGVQFDTLASGPTRASALALANRGGFDVAVNGGFWVAAADPDGMLVTLGRLLSDTTAWTGRHRNLRGGFGVDGGRAATAVIGRPASSFVYRVDDRKFAARAVNQQPRRDDLVVRTAAADWVTWPADAIELVMTADEADLARNVSLRAANAWGAMHAELPADTVTLVATGVVADRLAALGAGVLDVQWSAGWDGLQTAVAGGPLLLDRTVRTGVGDWRTEGFSGEHTEKRHPRTFVGVDQYGSVALGVIDGRQPGTSSGMTALEVQELGEQLGLVDLVMLDGGGSSTLVRAGTVQNVPCCDAGLRPITTILGLHFRR